MNIFELLQIPDHTTPLNIFNGRFYAYKNLLVDTLTKQTLTIDFTPIIEDNTICKQLNIPTPIQNNLVGITNQDNNLIYYEHYDIIKPGNNKFEGVDNSISYFIQTFNENREPIWSKRFSKIQPSVRRYHYYYKNNAVSITTYMPSMNKNYKKDYFNITSIRYDEFKHYNFSYEQYLKNQTKELLNRYQPQTFD